jgi:hypothetical protein
MKAKLVSAGARVRLFTCNVLQVVWKLTSPQKAAIQSRPHYNWPLDSCDRYPFVYVVQACLYIMRVLRATG